MALTPGLDRKFIDGWVDVVATRETHPHHGVRVVIASSHLAAERRRLATCINLFAWLKQGHTFEVFAWQRAGDVWQPTRYAIRSLDDLDQVGALAHASFEQLLPK